MKDNHKADVSHTDEFDRMYQEMVKQAEDKHKVKSEHPKTEEGIGLVDNLSSRWVNEFELPNGYIFKDENGNVINATKIVLEKKKKEYPKTYEECCKIMQVARPFMWFNYSEVNSISQGGDEYERHMENTLCVLRRLLICRDAYWKLYGEEMGLGKPWEPDWSIYEHKFCLGTDKDKVIKECVTTGNRILAFPTAEMRDAFKENFDPDIEICKELL